MMIGGFNVVSHLHKLLRSQLSIVHIQIQTGTTTPLHSAFLVNKRFSTPIKHHLFFNELLTLQI